VAREKKIPLIIAGGTRNHVHLLIALPAAVPLAKAVQELKGNSSRWLSQNGSSFAWQEGYAAFSVSPSNKRAVIAYISDQARHHAKRSFEQELVAILKKSEIDYDERYVFG
jgi:putative transposase